MVTPCIDANSSSVQHWYVIVVDDVVLMYWVFVAQMHAVRAKERSMHAKEGEENG